MIFRVWMSYTAFNIISIFRTKKTRQKKLSKLHSKNASRVMKKLVKLKGAVIKIAQLLATRPDFIPEEYCSVLQKLQDKLEPIRYKKIVKTFLLEFDTAPEQMFDTFEKESFASASLGQVHLATINNEKLAVKIQYPDIDKIVKNDIKNLEMGLKFFSKRFYSSYSSVIPVFNEIKKHVLSEIDYFREADNVEKFSEMFKDSAYVKIPKVYRKYSGMRVLTLQFLEGVKITRALEKETDNEIKDLILYRAVECFVDQIINYGVFQADAHPGNILITDKQEIIILDFGLIKYLSKNSREGFLKLGMAIINQDSDEMDYSFKKMGFKTDTGDMTVFHYFAKIFMSIFTNADVDEVHTQYKRFNTLLRQQKFANIPQDFILLSRIFFAINGLQAYHMPSENFKQILTNQKIKHDLDFEHQAKNLIKKLSLFIDVPSEMADNMEKLLDGINTIEQKLTQEKKSGKTNRLLIILALISLVFLFLGDKHTGSQVYYVVSAVSGALLLFTALFRK